MNTTTLPTRKKQLQEAKLALSRAVEGTEKLESFLQAARKQIQNQDTKQYFSVNKEILQSIQLLSHRANKAQVKVNLLSDSEIKLFGNPLKFNQIMTNLLANAVDAYDQSANANRVIEIQLQIIRSVVVIIVRDFGAGIPSQSLSKIFDPLFTTKSFDKGTGMGLAIVKQIVQRDLLGEIEVQSQLHKGTTFTVRLPLTSPPE